jgi:hypothetical protein
MRVTDGVVVADVERLATYRATAGVGRGSRLRMPGGRRRSPRGFAHAEGPETAKDRIGYIGLGDRGDDPTTTTTAVAEEDVDGKDLLQELGPWSTIGQPIRTAARWRWEVRRRRGKRVVARWRVNGMGGPLRGDHGGVRSVTNGAASASMGSEQTVVASQMDARRRDKRRQRREELQRGHDAMGGAVRAGALHAIGQVARGQPLDALVGHRRAQAVPANAFQTGTVAGRDADVRVQREALDAGAAWTLQSKVKAGTPGRLKSSRVEPLKSVIVEAALGWIDAPEESNVLRAIFRLMASTSSSQGGGRARNEEPPAGGGSGAKTPSGTRQWKWTLRRSALEKRWMKVTAPVRERRQPRRRARRRCTHGDTAAARQDHDLAEATTDRYRITGEVGRGGICRVLRARTVGTGGSIELWRVEDLADRNQAHGVPERAPSLLRPAHARNPGLISPRASR